MEFIETRHRRWPRKSAAEFCLRTFGQRIGTHESIGYGGIKGGWPHQPCVSQYQFNCRGVCRAAIERTVCLAHAKYISRQTEKLMLCSMQVGSLHPPSRSWVGCNTSTWLPLLQPLHELCRSHASASCPKCSQLPGVPRSAQAVCIC